MKEKLNDDPWGPGKKNGKRNPNSPQLIKFNDGENDDQDNFYDATDDDEINPLAESNDDDEAKQPGKGIESPGKIKGSSSPGEANRDDDTNAID